MTIQLDQHDFDLLPVTVDTDIMGGKPVFAGTRVPLEALWNNLADGATTEQFLEWFPTVAPEQVEAVLKHTFRNLAAHE